MTTSIDTTATDTTAGTTGPVRARTLTVAAWATPLLLLGGFALVAVIPVAVSLVAVLRDARLRALRWWAAALGLAYGVPFLAWLIAGAGGVSLTAALGPWGIGAISVVAIAFAVATHVLRRRAGRTGQPGI